MTSLPAKTDKKNGNGHKNPTPKQRIFLKKYLDELGKGTYKTKALVIAHKHAKYKGKNDVTRRQSALQIIDKITSSLAFNDILNLAGVDDKKVAGKLSYLMDCKKPVIVKGEIKEFPDNYVQLKAVETAMKHRGQLGSHVVAVQVNVADRIAADRAIDVTPEPAKNCR